jgi:hypothetical protein
VKSELDFPDILAADAPAIWHSGRAAGSGESIKRFARIIDQAAAIKASREQASPAPRARRTPAARAPGRSTTPRKTVKKKAVKR